MTCNIERQEMTIVISLLIRMYTVLKLFIFIIHNKYMYVSIYIYVRTHLLGIQRSRWEARAPIGGRDSTSGSVSISSSTTVRKKTEKGKGGIRRERVCARMRKKG